MRNRHVAIFNLPFPVLIHPTLTIVATLIRRGYKVTYVTSEKYAPELTRMGCDVLRTPRWEHPYNQDTSDARPIEQQYATDLFDLARRTVALTFSCFERHPPDLIVYDACAFAGLIVAERLRIPSVRITPQLSLDEANLDNAIIPQMYRDAVRKRRTKVTKLMHEYGVPRDDDVAYDRAIPTVYFYLEDFQLGEHSGDRNSIYAGRCASERSNIGRWQSASGAPERPIIIVSTTTLQVQQPEYYRKCLEALRDLPLHAVVALGSNYDAASLQPLPPHSEIAQNVPQLAIMPHASLIICLGGMTTTMECMYHGLPMLTLTHEYGVREAEIYGENVQRCDVGIHLSGANATAANIREAVKRLCTDATIQSKVRLMQHKIRRGPGSEEVVNWMEDYLALAPSDALFSLRRVENQEPIAQRRQ